MTERTSDPCPIGPVGDLIGNRWTTPILWALAHEERLRFGELAARLGTVSPKVLSERLRGLERDGLVTRTYHPEMPPRVEYAITELGRTLSPVFAGLVEWWDANASEVERARRAFDGG